MSILALGVGAAAVAAGVAQADGVVIESTSLNHPIGFRIEVGSMVILEDGAQVAVLDRSGLILRLADPGGVYEEPDAIAPARGGEGRQMSIAARLAMSFTGFGRRAGLGTMRSGLVECAVENGARTLPNPACPGEASSEAAASGPDEAAGGQADAATGVWGVTVWSDIEGHMTCDYAAEDGAWRRLPLGETGVVAIEASTLNSFTSAQGAALPAPAAAEGTVLRCQVVDAAVWSALQPHWRDDFTADEARALMEGFASVSGGTFAEVAE